jgi:Flp pilus assembly protein CpaB
MSRRGRAVAFGLAALGCAALAATIAGGYSASVAGQYGELRPVLVVTRDLPRGEVLDARDLDSRLAIRRIPESFVPPDALTTIAEAAGRVPATSLPAGSYVLRSQLTEPRRARERREPALARGLRPVQIAVTGAEALSAAGGASEGARVDVVVTTEPNVGGRGRTFVAAENVELLSLSEGGLAEGGAELGGDATWNATLALTRDQALRLIQAENFARQVRLMPHID